MANIITKLFPLWAITGSIAAFIFPGFFSTFKPLIIPMLSVVMFGMGMTLKWNNFRKVFHEPGIIFTGLTMQYLIMPLSAFVISVVFRLPPALIAGMVLVGSCPGGTASNVICYLAGGNVALSITLTMCSTIISILATPLLCLLYLNQYIHVPFWKMLISIIQIVLIPVLAGTTINSSFNSRLDKIRHIFPIISMFAIVFIIAVIIALEQNKLLNFNILIIVCVILHNATGLILGFIISRLLGYDIKTSKTLSIEVGMQNSGLGVALAIKFFSATAAVPGAIFSIWHNLSGSFLAGFWARKSKDN